ncbi:MAG: hypothetical protein AB7L92_01105 [Alphaproteobacteria bacterium]
MRALLAILLIFASSTAYAQRMRDFSLSPGETMREPDNINPNSTDPYLRPPPGGTTEGYGYGGSRNNFSSATGTPQRTFFMEEYCQPGLQPIIRSSRVRGIMECYDSVKQQACERFSKLPEDAVTLVDNTVRCVYQTAESGSGASYDVHCRQPYAEQLWVLKKYWNEPDTAYTILFLPDMVVDSTLFCQER